MKNVKTCIFLLLFLLICQWTNNIRSSQADTMTWNIRLHKLTVETSTKKFNTDKWRNLVSLLRRNSVVCPLSMWCAGFLAICSFVNFFFPVKASCTWVNYLKQQVLLACVLIASPTLCSFHFHLSPKYWAVPNLKLEFLNMRRVGKACWIPWQVLNLCKLFNLKMCSIFFQLENRYNVSFLCLFLLNSSLYKRF